MTGVVQDTGLTLVTTRRGIESEVLVMGPEGAPPVVYLHSALGPLAGEPMLQHLARRFHVHAPLWPGYGQPAGEELLDDMLDFALHGADVVDALDLGDAKPALIGHSMGGMIAAEMAALSPSSYGKLVLVAPLGLWLDDHPIPDVFAMLPFEFPPLLFHDVDAGTALMTGGLHFDDPEVIKAFLISNSRRLGTAGKVLFPIPNRRLAKRLYRVTNDVLLVWGRHDRYVPAAYADAWQALLPHAQRMTVDDAGHMAPYERAAEVASAAATFLEPT